LHELLCESLERRSSEERNVLLRNRNGSDTHIPTPQPAARCRPLSGGDTVESEIGILLQLGFENPLQSMLEEMLHVFSELGKLVLKAGKQFFGDFGPFVSVFGRGRRTKKK